MSPRTPEQNEQIRQQTRQQIIDAAFELFANDGYARTSISAVAEKAGVSKGLIYHYFESKEAILEAIFDHLVGLGEEVMDFPEHFSPADKIRQTIEQTFGFIRERPDFGRLMVALAIQPDTFSRLKPKINKVNKRQLAVYSDILRELGYEKPELEAYSIGAMMDGILMAYITMGDDYPIEEMKQKILDRYVPETHKENH